MTQPMELLYLLLGAIALLMLYLIYRQNRSVAHGKELLRNQEQMLSTQREDIRQREETISRMQQQMAEKDSAHLELTQQVQTLTAERDRLQTQLDDQATRAARLRDEIEARERDSAQSKALFATISNVAYDYVFVLDDQHTVIAANKSADGFFGDRNPLGENLRDLIDAPDLEDVVERALTEDESLEDQFVYDKRFFRVRAQVMKYDDPHVFIGIALQDVTQLVRLNRARRDMVANISHELRTPIHKIRLIIDSLFHEQSRPKRKASIESLHAIAKETEALQWVVEELFYLSMIESGQAIMKLVDEPLSPILDEGLERLSENLEDKSLQIVNQIPADLRVFCDREHVQRVFINLISNAIKWSPVGADITIGARAEGEEVIIHVFDKGPGVPDELCERIFERFYQLDPARSGGEGSGLGLAICKHIVVAHGGKIWAAGNSVQPGGRFFFTLLNAARRSEQPEDEQTDLPADTIHFPDAQSEVANAEAEGEGYRELVDGLEDIERSG